MEIPIYKIRRGGTRTSPEENKRKQTASTITTSTVSSNTKYTQVCDNTTMTDDKAPYGLYQNVGMITSPVSDQMGTASSRIPSSYQQQPAASRRQYLQRTFSDPHCPDFVNSSEELLLKSVYDNMMYSQQDASPDVTGMSFEMRRYSPDYNRGTSSRNLNDSNYPMGHQHVVQHLHHQDNHNHNSPRQNIELICNCDFKDFYFPRAKSRQKYNSDQNIMHSASRYNSTHKLDDSCCQKSHPTPLHQPQPVPEHFSLDRKMMKNKSSSGSLILTPVAKPRHTYSCEQNSRILQMIERKASSLRRQSPGRTTQRGLIRGGKYEDNDDAAPPPPPPSIGASSYNSMPRSGSRRGNLTSESELDDEPELLFDLSAGHLVDCQCPCDHLGYSSSYHHLQEEHRFPPAPDVTRRLQGPSSSSCTGPKQEVTFYRSSSTPAICSNSSSSGSGSSRFDLSTRHWWVIVTVLLLAAAAGFGVPIALRISAGASLEERMEFASRLLQEVPLIDGHNDLPWNIRKFLHNRLKDFKFGEDLRNVSPWSQSAWSHTDLPRLKQGHIAAQLNPQHTVPTLDDNGFVIWDSHAICAYLVSVYGKNDTLYPKDPKKRAIIDQRLHFDSGNLFPHIKGVYFWAAYVPCESQHRDAVQLTLEQIDVIRRFTEQYHPQLTLCTSAEEIRVAHQRHQLCSLIGVEGGHSLANSLAVLRTLYQVGVRYLTLTSTCNTPWADCSMADMPGRKAEHGGLTNFGKTVVKEMNRLGMIVDLSHVSVRTMRDALAVSKAPVIFSHSSAHALCNSTRNVPDATLRKLALNRGIVMVNFYSQFLTCKDVATVADAVAHINHIRDVAGVDNVGLGAGYDGINYTPKGLEDVSSYPALFAELIGSGGWSTEDLKKLAGLNFLRVLSDVERVRDEFRQAKVPPYEDLSPRVKNANCSSYDLI